MTEYIHKLGKVNVNFDSSTIVWNPHHDVEFKPSKINAVKWQAYAQHDINLEPKQIKLYSLNFGVGISHGLVVVSLVNTLKLRRISIQSETVVENVEDIVISIQNNADVDFVMIAGEALCYVSYHK